MSCQVSLTIDLGGIVQAGPVANLATASAAKARLVSRTKEVLTPWVNISDGTNGNDWANDPTLFVYFTGADMVNVNQGHDLVKMDVVLTISGSDQPPLQTPASISIEERN